MFVDVAGPAVVCTGNEWLALPAGTVTVAGTITRSGRPLDRLTIVPPAGAAAKSVTVPVAEAPADTLLGTTVTPDRPVGGGGGVPTGFTVRGAVSVTPAPVT